MSLGLSHSLSRYKLKFSPDKVGGRHVIPPHCIYDDFVVLVTAGVRFLGRNNDKGIGCRLTP